MYSLGTHVVGRAARRVRQVLGPFGEAEVGELEVAVVLDEYILGLEVAIDDVVDVQVLEREEYVGRVEARLVLVKAASLLQQQVQVAVAHEIETKVDVRAVLEAEVQLDDVRVVAGGEYVALAYHAVDLPLLVELGLGEHLDGVEFVGGLVVAEQDAAERARAERAQQREVGDLELGVRTHRIRVLLQEAFAVLHGDVCRR